MKSYTYQLILYISGSQTNLTLELPQEFQKYAFASPPNNCDLMHLKCDLSIRIFERSPGDSNVQKSRTTAIL